MLNKNQIVSVNLNHAYKQSKYTASKTVGKVHEASLLSEMDSRRRKKSWRTIVPVVPSASVKVLDSYLFTTEYQPDKSSPVTSNSS